MEIIEANPNVLVSFRDSDDGRFATQRIHSYPDSTSKLAKPETLAGRFGVSAYSGHITRWMVFESAEIDRLVQEFQFGGSLTITAADNLTGSLKLSASSNFLSVSLQIESGNEQLENFDFEFLNHCYSWIRQFLDEGEIAKHEPYPHERIPAQFRVTDAIEGYEIKQFESEGILNFRLRTKTGSLERKFKQGCRLLDLSLIHI